MSTKIISKPQDRVDGKLKVTGQAIYAGVQNLENLAYGYLLTSTVTKGSIETMDTSVAERSPGVAAVYTSFNPLKLYRDWNPRKERTAEKLWRLCRIGRS